MKKLFCLIVFITFYCFAAHSQKVGLVLSGGGARGLTHIGLIKALEENNIPIDYITGTSMGAIVGGMYAKGLTTDEIIAIFKSSDFRQWSTGVVLPEERYYYFSPEPRPIGLTLKFKVKNLLHLDSFNITPHLAVNFVMPTKMNIAFMELFASANAAAEYDFDKLFVPFRCVASDIHNEKTVVFSKGNFNDAVRASMTFPMMYKPITIDDELLFDGGIYNNFPIDVMRADFAPDYIIGSVVAHNPAKPDANNILTQLKSMIMRKTNYHIPESDGIAFNYELDRFSLFNFSPIDEMVKIGYDSAMARMPELKQKILRRMDTAALAEKRSDFRQKTLNLKFQNIIITGVDSLQKEYIQRLIRHNDKEFTFEMFQKKYFMGLSDPKIKDIVPHAQYNPENQNFDLLLDVTVEEPVILQLGGNLSTSSMSGGTYFAATYRNLSRYAFFVNAEALYGRSYNMYGLNSRIDIPTRTPFFINFTGIYHRFSPYETRWFYEDYIPPTFDKQEAYAKINVGFPVKMRGRFEVGMGYGLLTDDYNLTLNNSTGISFLDVESRYLLGTAFIRYEDYTLNRNTYSTEGYSSKSVLQFVGGRETFMPNVTNSTPITNPVSWFQYHGYYDYYKQITQKFTMGLYGELALSFRDFSNNYMATIIQAPSFAPTQHSKITFNSAYSALQFLALGMKPIYRMNDRISFRTEGYCFLPLQEIVNDAGLARYKDFSLSASKFFTEATLVLDYKPITIGVFANYYSTAVNNWGFGINVGFLLFNRPFLE